MRVLGVWVVSEGVSGSGGGWVTGGFWGCMWGCMGGLGLSGVWWGSSRGVEGVWRVGVWWASGVCLVWVSQGSGGCLGDVLGGVWGGCLGCLGGVWVVSRGIPQTSFRPPKDFDHSQWWESIEKKILCIENLLNKIFSLWESIQKNIFSGENPLRKKFSAFRICCIKFSLSKNLFTKYSL